MAREVNGAAVTFAHGCMSGGHVNTSEGWSFSADDGNAMLGANGDDWANYGKHFMAVNTDQPADTKAHYSYPFAKDGTVYRSGLAAVRQRAAQQKDDAVFEAAGKLMDMMDMMKPGREEVPLGRRLNRWMAAEVRALGDDQVAIRMTTDTRARDGHILPPAACLLDEYNRNPIQLWRHDSNEPVGTNSVITRGEHSIDAVTTFAPLGISPVADKVRGLVKSGIVRGVSIGFRILDGEPIDSRKPYDGIRATKWELLECSFVPVPSDPNAEVIARELGEPIDTAQRAASGTVKQVTNPASVLAPKPTISVKANQTMPKTVAEQISAFEATRQAKTARMGEIMDGAAEKGETLDQAQQEEYDGLRSEVDAIDGHLKRLGDHQKMMAARAVPVGDPVDPQAGSRARAGLVPATVRAASTVEKGIGFTRFVLAVARAKGNLLMAERIAQANEQWMAETPQVAEVIRSAVAAGTTSDSTWAGPLVQYQQLASEFIDYLRPMTILGNPAMRVRRVPFKVRIPRQTSTSTANWVGEGQAKPVSAIAFDSVTLDPATISDIVIITQQLASYSNPSAEMLVRDDLAAKIANFMDAQFVDPTVASTGVSPASITYGVTPTVATGTTADALRTDVGTLFETFLEANLQLNNAVWIMSQVTAARISLIRSSLGTKEYPEINVNGGMFEGLPVITSQSVPGTGGSPTDGYPIILVSAGDILVADEGQVRIDASSEASVQMDSAPDSPTTGSTNLVSFWQQGFLGIKADRDINWAKRRSTCVALIQSAKYTTG